jgi:hypothetical protein
MSLETATKATSPIKLVHAVLRTSQDAFYKKAFLGGRASYENAMLPFITYNDEHRRVAVMALNGLRPKGNQTSGLEHIAFTRANLDDLLQAFQQRKELGINPT